MPEDIENEEFEDEISIPGFQSGGRVRETGIALVHEGEFIVPAPGSEAEIEPAETDGQGVINYYFPVEIVIVGTLPEEEREAIETRVWEKLSDALEGMA
ncbi:MAG: hypothetical protein GY774_20870 [Planctomycetes bacterium]|nr:hypothetical protein [Planctomycetota bacterium]